MTMKNDLNVIEDKNIDYNKKISDEWNYNLRGMI